LLGFTICVPLLFKSVGIARANLVIYGNCPSFCQFGVPLHFLRVECYLTEIQLTILTLSILSAYNRQLTCFFSG
jgi:hypothetical protein